MSRTGATCPCCGAIMTMRDIRLEGRAGRLGAVMTAVVVNGLKGKEYRLPTEHELAAAEVTEEELQALYADIPFGLPEEQTPESRNRRIASVLGGRCTASTRGGSCLPIGSYWRLGSLFAHCAPCRTT